MRFLFGALILMLVSMVATLAVLREPGYLLLEYGPWSLETNLGVAGLALLCLFLVFYLLLRVLGAVWRAPRRLRDWEQRRERRAARRALIRGLLDLAEGNWSQAEHQLVRWADRSEMPLLNYLSAARAAQQQGRDDQRDRYLRLAHANMPAAEVAVSLTQAELQLSHHQHEQALATLMHLRRMAPRHTYVLRLLRTLYEQLADWPRLLELLPELRRQRLFGERELADLERRIHQGLLQQAADRGDRAGPDAYWHGLSRTLQRDPELLNSYLGWLVRLGGEVEAEKLLRTALPGCWTPALVERYGRLAGADPKVQLTVAESWLREHAGDPTLLLTLGRLCLRNRLWGKARGCFEASLGAGGPLRGEAYQELGTLLLRMGDRERALACYREGLELAVGASDPKDRPTAQIIKLAIPRDARNR